jgi:protein-S-isoprenylcysteine O-methyltransferase Ste14
MASRRLPAYFVIGVVLAWQIWQHTPNPWTLRQTAGLSLVIAGFCFWLTAHIQLGASFSLTPQARALVSRGLYSKVRNPIYFSGAILIVGLALFWDRLYFLWAFAVLIPLQIWRARKEARVLEEKFGEEYRAYRRQTWF